MSNIELILQEITTLEKARSVLLSGKSTINTNAIVVEINGKIKTCITSIDEAISLKKASVESVIQYYKYFYKTDE